MLWHVSSFRPYVHVMCIAIDYRTHAVLVLGIHYLILLLVFLPCMQDFATSSLKGEVATENAEVIALGTLEEYTISERKEWEKR